MAMLSVASVLVAIVVVLLVGVIGRHIALLPWLRRRHYEAQGLRGPAFRFILGNQKERVQAMLNSASKDPVPFDQLTAEIVLPELHALSQQYGLTFVHEILWTTVLTVGKPDQVKEVLVKQAHCYIKAPIIRKLLFSVLGNGLVFSEGEFWRQQRKIHDPAFQKTFLRGLHQHIQDCSDELTERWREKIRHNGGTAQVEATVDMSTTTLDIIARSAFGANIPGSAPTSKGVKAFDSITPLFTGNMKKIFSIIPLVPGYRYLPTLGNVSNWQREKFINNMLDEILVARLKAVEARTLTNTNIKHPYGNDLLGMMIEAWKDGMPTMTRKQLLDECKTIFVAGHSTTALGITWALFFLATRPEWQHRLRKEIQDVGTQVENFGKLKQMDMFIKEVHRLHSPVANIFRECRQAHRIGDIQILPGTLVIVPILLLHQTPEFWGHDFDQFKPERWENKPAYGRDTGASFTFGGGQRHCLGKEFAIMETISMLISVLTNFEVSLSPTYRHAPGQAQSIRPLYGMDLVIKELQA
eukprot:TRINITY_DN3523_c0_g1_i1.p1 TRINITY_DN3523_c0_g1~~TRINITY_DN3523_c0_g1_i1.p1  ORF type:complete len:526 (+),score=84.25 TRINITY_DN3523_c0_g1_i1:346-1923(+)